MSAKSALGAALGLSLLAVTAFAHSGAMGIVKERMDGMVAMGKALGTVGDMVKGKTTFEREAIAAAALAVERHAAEIPNLFPDTAKSRKGKMTEALPSIWERPHRFAALANELEARSARLAQIARTADRKQIRAGFTDILKTCSACHQVYRRAGD